MGESSRRDRSSSRSPRRHRDDRPSESRSKHHHRSHRRDDDEEEDRHRRRKGSKKDRDETEEERKERKRLKKEKRRSERRKDQDDGLDIVDDDDEAGEWVEKGIEDVPASVAPRTDDLNLKSHVDTHPKAPLPPTTATSSSTQERQAWMLEPTTEATPTVSTFFTDRNLPKSAGIATRKPMASSAGDGMSEAELLNRNVEGEMDLFSSLGTEHKRKDPEADKPDPSKPQVYRNELNQQLVQGKSLDEYETKEEKEVTAGGPGYQWRMMKLKRLHEQAEEQGKSAEEIALERYGSLEEFREALEERRILDEREHRRQSRRGGNSSMADSPSTAGTRTPDVASRRFMFTSDEGGFGSRPSSRAGFRRPGEEREGFQTPGASASASGSGGRVDELRRRESGTPGTGPRGTAPASATAKVATPIPSVFTPSLGRTTSGYPFPTPTSGKDTDTRDPTSSKPPLSTAELNKLQARVLRAKLMDDTQAQALEEEYEYERHKSQAAADGLWEGAGEGKGTQGQMGREVQLDAKGRKVEVQVLPTLDGRGKLYDVGTGKEDAEHRPGNKRKKVQKFETRDREGNLLRYNADDDEMTLGELVRQEKFGAGAADQKNLDAEMASAIGRDARFQDDMDYMDDNADKLARKKMKTDAMKRAFAINDYARTKRALDSCPFCWQDDRNPLAAIVALGARTYLACTMTEELVDGHCLIVPQQHCLSSLEMEDDDWDEVKNFMKCLMRMHAKDNKGVLFYETILSFRQQRHTFIEAVPVPFEQFQDAPAYFRESILASESEWTQHKKLIDFSSRPGGFRRALVSNLPYFMVQWDYKGEKGYGHIIEGVDDAAGRGEGEDDLGGAVAEGNQGGAFPPYFAAEIIGNLLGLEPRKWRKPRTVDLALNQQRASKLGNAFQPYNWTVQLQQS